ncbi:capsular polysaccharide biosynthesis protein [Flocculibacter collagenilyticus]|uniref:capsular polysaccharide biosynthesis protein n=1 Tax=Flocculibacter collagenilyticus TaxID=2744479 RepID=UPI0018F4A3E1|nr:capsular polysaccharide biosynthesis protein [Flocculibacter collagenilyticus]
MAMFTCSKGLLNRKRIAVACLEQDLMLHTASSEVMEGDVFVGWGNKKTAKITKLHAQKEGCAFLHLEDGFIGYIGHPEKKGFQVSLVRDDFGIYYDARSECRLELLIKRSHSDAELKRAEKIVQQVKQHGITKYNIYQNNKLPLSLAKKIDSIKAEKILIIDQVAGDLGIEGAEATENDFYEMLSQARLNHPSAQLLIRTHPDTRFGKKKGVLSKALKKLPKNCTLISEGCHPHALINEADVVYTVSSQMGFEALILGKPVYCFGMPFYAGWGLTTDVKKNTRRKKADLLSLVAASLIDYPLYFNPVSGKRCEIEDVIALIAKQKNTNVLIKNLYLVGFSSWKKAFMTRFCANRAEKLIFKKKLPQSVSPNDRIAVWGMKYPDLESCIRVEDGFIRSSGLGSNLCPPSSLSLDENGIYFNSQKPSDLEELIQSISLTEQQCARAKALLFRIRTSGVSKYNVGLTANFCRPITSNKVILVVGQVDGDASIQFGSPRIKSNEELLFAVRKAEPDAFIIYKPHPDVVSGNRNGSLSEKCLSSCTNLIEFNVSLYQIFPHIDEIHTMTSLSGFEALIFGVEVHTWGQPFYAGWGLTKDHVPINRRESNKSLEELAYCSLIEYPNYIDWDTGLNVEVEDLIDKLASQASKEIERLSRIQRWQLKSKLLLNTLLLRFKY